MMIDRERFRKVRWFFIKVTLHVLWWDIILRRPLLARLRTPYIPRWQKIARDFRELAVEMGGVLIKLGQFLSVRVDLLPEEVLAELSGLQDEVPAENFDAIVARIEDEFSRPIDEIFAWISTEVLGSASLAQTHRAQVPSGETVVVKVLRPNIETIVETDLIAIAEFVRRLKFYKPIRRAVDLDRLTDEFDRVTSRELDLLLEGRNAERFAADYADDAQIYTPAIFWDHCTVRTLTMEDVGYLTLDDLPALRAAGIDPRLVAQVLTRCTLEQTLVHFFVHADPHTGNLFVRPLLTEAERAAGAPPLRPGDPVPAAESRPFQVVYIDFGMAIEVAERLRRSMRDYTIGVATDDAHSIIQSYIEGDMLLPGADIGRLEELTEQLLSRYSDSMLGQMQNTDFIDLNSFFISEYRDLLDNPPLQFQSELLFVFRAMGLVSGLTAKLAPDFDLWTEAQPVVQRLIETEIENNRQDWTQKLQEYGLILARLPKRLDDVLTQAQRGQLTVVNKPSAEQRRAQLQLRTALARLTWVIAASALLVGGILWRVGDQMAAAPAGHASPSLFTPSTALIVASVCVFLWGMRRQ